MADLIPWPGPQVMPEIVTRLLPWPIEMQSSPVATFELDMVTPVLPSRWMPSVLGLVPGALMVMPLPLKLWQPSSAMWKNLLLSDVIPLTTVSFVFTNFTDCTHYKQKALLGQTSAGIAREKENKKAKVQCMERHVVLVCAHTTLKHWPQNNPYTKHFACSQNNKFP